jgi:hypothetical protein
MRDAVAMTFEWQQVFRLIYTNGSGASTPLQFWMGDSRGRWTATRLSSREQSQRPHLVRHGGQLPQRRPPRGGALHDARCRHHPVSGDHRGSKGLHPSVDHHRSACAAKEMVRVLEYQCRAEMEEAKGEFKPEPRTWYQPGSAPVPPLPSGNPTGLGSRRARGTSTNTRRQTGHFGLCRG